LGEYIPKKRITVKSEKYLGKKLPSNCDNYSKWLARFPFNFVEAKVNSVIYPHSIGDHRHYYLIKKIHDEFSADFYEISFIGSRSKKLQNLRVEYHEHDTIRTSATEFYIDKQSYIFKIIGLI
jgi:hypothetical protein